VVREEEIFSGPAKLAMVQPVAIAFNQSPDEVFLSPIKYMKTGDSASLVGIYSKRHCDIHLQWQPSWSSFHCSSRSR
jgi:hypothetical protein